MRRLTTIVALDVAGYSALTEADEAGATAAVAAVRSVVEAAAAKHSGRLFNTAGDGFMLEFASSAAAVEAALELAGSCEPRVRVGVHLGDVAVQPNGDLLGHGVNVAARLMAQASPGSALVSADVRRTIRGILADRLLPLGTLHLDKMQETIDAFVIAATETPAVAIRASAEPTLVVLPFDNLSNDPEMQFFSDGLSEEILQAVANVDGVRVIGRSTSFQFRGPDKAVAKVARELKASHVLDGSVRRADGAVRVTAQLIDAATQTTLWSDRFERTLSNTFAVQDEVAAAVAGALDLKLASSRGPHGVAPSVYDIYLRGAEFCRDIQPEAQVRAAGLLEDATRRAPAFAAAWGKLALARAQARFLSIGPARGGDEALGKIRDAANRALALDPGCVPALAALFVSSPLLEHRERAALVKRVEAAAMGRVSSSFVMSGVHLLEVGRCRDAVDAFKKGDEIDPLFQIQAHYYAHALLCTGEEARAFAKLTDAAARWPYVPFFAASLISWHAAARAFGEVDRLLAPERLAYRAPDVMARIALMRDGRQGSWTRLREAELAIGNSAIEALAAATTAGMRNDAFDFIDANALPLNAQAARRPDDLGTIALFLPFCGEMRRDPRFVRLCAKLKLVDFWMETGLWPDCIDEVPYDFRAACSRAS